MTKSNQPEFEISENLTRFSKQQKFSSGYVLGEDFTPNAEQSLGKFLTDRLIGWWGKLIIFGLLVLLIKILFLQVFNGNYYSGLAEGNRLRVQYSYAPRGLIYDRNQIILAKNIPRFSLALIPADLPKETQAYQQTLEAIAKIINLTSAQISQLLQGVPTYSYQAIPIKDNLDYNEALKLQIAASDYPGLILLNTALRQYVAGNSLAHFLGYVGKISAEELKTKNQTYLYNDIIGKLGLEYAYENELRGQHGERQIEVDALGQEKRVIKDIPTQPGDNLVLTIDAELQAATEQALKKILTLYGKKRAVVIVQNPQTGEILTLVNLPDFNNNDFVTGFKPGEYEKLVTDPNRPMFFRAIAGEYPSGSTIKPVIAAAALQEKIITNQTTVNSTGGLWIGNSFFFPDWKAGGHGATNVYRAIAESVNTFFYMIGGGYGDFVGLGPEKIAQYEKLFGFGQPTNLDLPGERDGFVPTPDWKKEVKNEAWYIGDTYHVSIGQGDFLTTPIQLINALSVFANGGKLYQPYLVKTILNSNNQVITQSKPTLIRQNPVNPENIEIIKQAMRQTITNGVAKSLQAVPMAIAGKTGTAQSGTTKPTHAWFVGFAPFDQPQITVLVLIEEGGEGSSVAVPVAKEIFQWWYDHRIKTNIANQP
ncbi:MAG: penicillin-binding protein 2 [Candidatus Buchananbacteria bacterium]